jgi:hypothetical protein
MIKAVYIAREDGNYDFLAAFSEEHDYDVHPAETYADVKVEEGEEVILKDFKDLEHLTDVIEGWEANFEKKLGAIKL